MEFECSTCNKKFGSEDGLKQHSLAKHASGKEKKKINFKKYFIGLAILLILIFGALSIKSYMNKPGNYDEFAKCLTEKGAIIYGNDFCQYTMKQINYFGNSKKFLNYIKCIDNKELCDSKGVKVTPTWEINGKMYEQVQTFDRLATLSECEVK